MKLKFEDYQHILGATQLEYKINQLEKNKLDVLILKENHRKIIRKHWINIKIKTKI